MKLLYDKSSETIRQMPENYLIARKQHNTRWICDPDVECQFAMASAVFEALFDINIKYGSGLEVIKEANKILNMRRCLLKRNGR